MSLDTKKVRKICGGPGGPPQIWAEQTVLVACDEIDALRAQVEGMRKVMGACAAKGCPICGSREPAPSPEAKSKGGR